MQLDITIVIVLAGKILQVKFKRGKCRNEKWLAQDSGL